MSLYEKHWGKHIVNTLILYNPKRELTHAHIYGIISGKINIWRIPPIHVLYRHHAFFSSVATFCWMLFLLCALFASLKIPAVGRVEVSAPANYSLYKSLRIRRTGLLQITRALPTVCVARVK